VELVFLARAIALETPSEFIMKLRSFFYILAAGATALLLVAVGGFFWITSQSPINLLQGGKVTEPSAAIFVPKQAPVMASLLVNPERLETFQQLVTRPGDRRRARVKFDRIENSLLSSLNLDYARDIQPWLGDEMAWAVTALDFDRNAENGAQPGYLLAVTTDDAQQARESLQLYYSREAVAGTEDLVFEQYKGVNLIYKRPLTLAAAQPEEIPQTLTSAVVGDRYVLFANHPKVLRDAINNVQVTTLNLASDPEYQQMLDTLSEPRIGLSFVNLPALAAWIANQPIPTRESFKRAETLSFTLTLNRQGVLAQTAFLGAGEDETSQPPALSKPVDALQYIPAQSVLAVAGTDLNHLWTQLSDALADDETLNPLLNQTLTRIQSRFGLQLPEEIFSWVRGEYALALLPHPDRERPDWIFVVQKAAGEEAQESIAHLDTLAKERGLSVGVFPIDEQNVTAWTKLTTSVVAEKANRAMKLEAQVQGTHASVDNYEIFATSIAAMDAALAGLEHSLLENAKFQAAIAPLPQQNDGYLYLDWASGDTTIERQFPVVGVAELIGQPLLNQLRSLSISSYGIEGGVQRSKVFFRLARAKETD
jgi:hypothetical protein